MDCEVLIVGSGAAGLSAAAIAAAHGLDTLVIERQEWIGGTTALSEGMIWVPCSHQARQAGCADSPAAARAYLAQVCGPLRDEARIDAYLDRAPAILQVLTDLGAADFYLATGSIDYTPEAEGAARGARSLCPRPLDGRQLGELFDRLHPPLRSSLLFGGMTVASGDYRDFTRVFREVGATIRVARLAAAYARDRLSGARRGYRIANGQALVGRLARAAADRGARFLTGTAVEALDCADGRVVGARLRSASGASQVRASRGVILAGGGITGDPALAGRFLPNLAAGQTHLRLVSGGVRGDGWKLGRSVGAAVVEALDEPCAWAPASRVPLPGGETESFPHFIERAKPGLIAVDGQGRRFANEADTYHRFARRLVDHSRKAPDALGWIIADHRALRRYGIGAVAPWPARIGPHLDRGYLVRGRDIEELARRIGVPAATLRATIADFNEAARAGTDADFGRGQSGINRHYADQAHGPNPSLGALTSAPFYAVRIHPSDIGGFVGLKVDDRSRVLDGADRPIAGLYAAGNDAASMFGGAYPAGGATIGPALIFGGIAALDLADRPSTAERAPELATHG